MRGRLSGLSTLCKRFAAILRHCDVESFLNIGRIHPEIAPMEKRIDLHIDLLRRDEFREMECVSDVIKYVCAMTADFIDRSSVFSECRHNSSILQKLILIDLITTWVNGNSVMRCPLITTWTYFLLPLDSPRHLFRRSCKTTVTAC